MGKLDDIVLDALEQRLLTPERLRDLLSSWLDHTKHAVGRVGCQPHLPVPNIEREWCAQQDSNLRPQD